LHSAFENDAAMSKDSLPDKTAWELLDGMPDPLICLDGDMQVIYANRAAEAGLDGRRQLKDTVRLILARFEATGPERKPRPGPQYCAYLNQPGPGGPAPFEITLTRSKLGGNPIYWLQLSRVSSADPAPAAHRISEGGQLFQNAFEDAAVGMIIFDGAGRVLQANPFICNLLGYKEAQLIGKHYVDFTHEPDKVMSLNWDKRLLNGDLSFASYEKRYQHKDGSPVWVQVSNTLMRDDAGQPRYFVAHCQDIRQRKQAEERLRESEKRFQLFMDQLPGKVFIKNDKGRYLYGNRFFNRITQELAGRPAAGLHTQELYPRECASQMMYNDKVVLATGRVHESIEQIPGKDGEAHWLTCKFPITQKDADTLIGGIGLDITARVKARQELEARDKELELQKEDLKRVNTALKVMMEHRQDEMLKKERDTLASIKKLVMPYLERLQLGHLDPEQESYLAIALDNLHDLASEFAGRLSTPETLLSPTELQVADLLRHDRSSDEIAGMMAISPHTVARHRASIRKKLGLTNQKINLKTYLQSLSSH
jgi:PAS domain S-box-containing protein